MNYLIIEKETDELIDLIDLTEKDKLIYEKKHPEHFLEEATEEELFLDDGEGDEW
jgi:hypothetical protein